MPKAKLETVAPTPTPGTPRVWDNEDKDGQVSECSPTCVDDDDKDGNVSECSSIGQTEIPVHANCSHDVEDYLQQHRMLKERTLH